LYDWWKTGGLRTISQSKEQFGINKDFIKTAIVMSLKLNKRKPMDTLQLIYETLKSGNDYTADGTTIPCTPEDIEFWSEKRKQHQRFLNSRYNKIFEEFQHYLTFRNEENIKPLDYVAQQKITPSRDNPSRLAKDKILPGNFTGMTTNDYAGSKRKGKTGNLDQVNRVIAVFYVIKYNLCFTSIKGLGRLRS